MVEVSFIILEYSLLSNEIRLVRARPQAAQRGDPSLHSGARARGASVPHDPMPPKVDKSVKPSKSGELIYGHITHDTPALDHGRGR